MAKSQWLSGSLSILLEGGIVKWILKYFGGEFSAEIQGANDH
jgi:hypothetical protein